MSGVITAIGVAASVASAAYSMSQGGAKVSTAASGDVSSAAARGDVSSAAAAARKARSSLLETAGGQAGESLTPGQTSANKDTLFGN